MLTGILGWFKATTSLPSFRQNTLDEPSFPRQQLEAIEQHPGYHLV
jgi:hypothetical protein